MPRVLEFWRERVWRVPKETRVEMWEEMRSGETSESIWESSESGVWGWRGEPTLVMGQVVSLLCAHGCGGV